MRAAVYNRYWLTGGGGEAYGAGVAHVLRQRGDVDLLCHDPVQTDWLAERLRIPLDGVRARRIPDRPGAVTDAAAEYDLFVNVSHMSDDPAPHDRSLYVVYFPTPPELALTRPKKAVVRGMRTLAGPPPRLEYVDGFFGRDPGLRGVRWTAGDGVLRVSVPDGARAVPITIVFGTNRPEPTDVRVEADGRLVGEARVGGRVGRSSNVRGIPMTFVVDGDGSRAHTLRIRSSTFVPGGDARELGVPVREVRVGRGVRPRLETALPWLTARGEAPAWRSTYGSLIAISEFTRQWIQTWWSVDSEILYPPVTMRTPGPKEPIILNVGRFFPAHQGHSKKQLEMVRAFRRLVDGGLDGWTLHLVGGCATSGRPYLDEVLAAARGYPVEVHVDAPGDDLEELYSRASIYWHASGLGENQRRHPGRFEHFGISTVEAMSAGAVPVVIGVGGQLETVRHGIDGFHFRGSKGLVALTRLVVDDADLRAAMSASSVVRARQFSLDSFGARLWSVVDALPRYGPARP